ncbi:FtsX-like permease family protein [Virgisporangium ochraceum]|uniref:ABC3 transporter permease C-terminal domain-containing protein n=1 Tax=Virgisporangium ochraceum TaxID=65505 RepID=A0A8J3ZVV6_9ACTN|nr:FtsX-like permease family protein [Virgisporangium ochraceum]GIJ70128.1 hypothetical protein Voc01_050450 [Virgisporangium ochraceum]
MRLVLLGLRMSVGSGRGGLLRAGLMSSGAALGVLLVLACLAAVSVTRAQDERARDRSPVYAADDSGYSTDTDGGSRYTDRPVTAGATRLIEIDDAIGHLPLRRIAIGGATPATELPPGLARFPAPGEIVVSPALAELIRTDARARERFPQPIVGTIGRAGLIAPNELRAYVGVAADNPGLDEQRALEGFGGALRYGRGDEMTDPDVFTPGRYAAGAFTLFVLVPFGVFLATCARLSATTRDRRIASLRLLGVSTRQAAVVNVVETGVVAGAGALLGAVLFSVLAPLSTGWPIGRLQWFASDASVAPGGMALVVGVTVAFAVAVGVLAGRSARLDPLGVRRGAPASRPSPWRLLPLVGGLAGATAAGRGGALPTDARGWLMLGSVLVTGLGLALALPVLSYAVAGLVQRLPVTPVWLGLAAARVRHSPGVAPRLVASLTVAIYVAGLGSLGIALVASDQDLLGRAEQTSDVLLQVPNPTPTLMADLRATPGTTIVALPPVPLTVGGAEANGVLGDCAELLAMYRLAAGQSCVDGQVYWMEFSYGPGGREPDRAGDLRLADGTLLPTPAATLTATPRFNVGISAPVFVTRQVPAVAGFEPETLSFDVVAADRAAVERAARVVSARAPATYLGGDLGGYRGVDTNFMVLFLVCGLIVTFVLGVGSFAAAAVDRTIERRRDNATLIVVGTRPAVVAAGEAGSGALPLALGLVTASAATLVIAFGFAALLKVDAGFVVDRVAPVLWLAGAALLTGLVLTTVPAYVTQRVTAESLRRP